MVGYNRLLISIAFLLTGLFSSGSTVCAQVIEQDSLALVAFYNATNGPLWGQGTTWLTGPVSNWKDVTVTGNRVTSLDISDYRVVGRLPSEMRVGTAGIGLVLASVMALAPVSLAAQTNQQIQTSLVRYVDPVILGELGGFVLGAIVSRPLFYDEYGDTLDYTSRAVITALMVAHVGGIVGATIVAQEKEYFLLYSIATHAAISSGIYFSSPDLSNSTAVTAALIYLVAAPIMTMGIASIVDTANARRDRRISVQPHLDSYGNRFQAGLRFTYTGH